MKFDYLILILRHLEVNFTIKVIFKKKIPNLDNFLNIYQTSTLLPYKHILLLLCQNHR